MSDAHGGGCFSFSWRKRKKPAKAAKPVGSTPSVTLASVNGYWHKARAKGLPVTTVNQTVTPAESIPTKKEESAEDTVVPSTTDYAIEATKRTLDILKGAAGLIPVPLVAEVIEIGLSVLSTCEAINEVQEKVNVLKNRIAEFLLVIAKIARDKNDQPIVKLSEDLVGEMEELKRCLVGITTRLDQIKDQNRLLTALLPDSNKETIQECLVDFQDSIDRFQTLRGIHASQDLSLLQTQVADMYGLTQEALRKVDRIEGRVEEVHSAVNELKAMVERQSNPASYRPAGTMPPVPTIFFGRTGVVDAIAKGLCSTDSPARICILGPGGQGKTSTALAVMNHPNILLRYPTTHRFWVPCIGANSPATFLTILAKHLKVTSKTDDPLQAIFTVLNETEEPRLILLDNFETPWHPIEGSQQAIKDILQSLDSLPHVNILVTMRSEFPPLDHWTAEKLQGLDVDDARKIYTAIDKDARPSPELDDLLAALGYLPYAVTLMATRGKRSLSSPAELLQEWKQSGTDMLSKAEEGMDHSIELSVNSKFVSNSPGALHLLQVLSMLPAGVFRNDLSTWIKSWESDALDTLREAALVRTTEVENENGRKIHLFVLPVVQSYMHRQNRIPQSVRDDVNQACLEFLVTKPAGMTGPSFPNFQAQIVAISIQETNLQALFTKILADAKLAAPIIDPASPPPLNKEILPDNASPSTMTIQAGLIFGAYQFWTKPRTELAEETISLAVRHNDSWREAEGRFLLGHALWRLNANRESANHLEKARDIYLALNKHARGIRSDFMAAICTFLLPDMTPEKRTERINGLFADWEPRAVDDKEVQTWLLHYKSQLDLLLFNNPTQGIDEALASEKLFMELNLPYEAGLSEFVAARCYNVLEKYEDAVNLLDKHIKGFLASHTLGSLGIMQDLGPAYIFKAKALKALDRWDDDLQECLKASLEASQEAGLGVQAGQDLVEFAEVYVRNKDWPAARLAYEEAIKKCARVEELTARWIVDHSQHNLRYVESQENGGTDESIEFVIPWRK